MNKFLRILDSFNFLPIANFITITVILILPYIIFSGGLFIGGDDSKSLYFFPIEYIQKVSFYSWINFSSMGVYGPSQGAIPLPAIAGVLQFIVGSRIVVGYLIYSLPFILGFLYFQKMIKEFISGKENAYNFEIFVGSLIYIFSPILIVNQWYNFLTPVWLVGLFPIIIYYLQRYIITSNLIYVYKNILWCSLFSLTLFTIPWMLGFILPIGLGLVFGAIYYKRRQTISFVRKGFIFFTALGISQAFWLFPVMLFFYNLSASGNNIVTKALFSQDLASTFELTVRATASGNVIYPLLNFFHRQIAFDFGWYLSNIFIGFYDKTFFLSTIFLGLLFFAINSFKTQLRKNEQRIFSIFLIAFIFSLFCFTVNIGPLREVFIFFGQIPGFVMFRNFYEKFALGYIFIYATILTYSLIMLRRKSPNFRIISVLTLLVVIVNFLPIRNFINQPFWTTKNTYGYIKLPDEYIDFTSEVKSKIQPTSYILSLPLNIGSYSIITDDEGKVSAGNSLIFRILTDVTNVSGYPSFDIDEKRLRKDILDRDYKDLSSLLHERNINYILEIKNISNELKGSFLFEKAMMEKEDELFINALAGKKIIESRNGNYILYETKNPNTILFSKNLIIKRINQVKYKLFIRNLKETQALEFLESFNQQWKLYLEQNPAIDWCTKIATEIRQTKECVSSSSLLEMRDILFLLKKPIFEETQSTGNGNNNRWVIDPEIIKKEYDKSYYSINEDGGIDIEMTLYFAPQNHFYIGTAISAIFLFGFTGYMFIRKKHK